MFEGLGQPATAASMTMTRIPLAVCLMAWIQRTLTNDFMVAGPGCRLSRIGRGTTRAAVNRPGFYRRPPAHLRTERLVLRAWTDADLDPLAKIFAMKAVWQFPFDRGLTREETAAFLERQQESWRTHGFGLWATELRHR